MSGNPLNLPKWLWLLLVLGIFGGQWHQMTCRMVGHDDRAMAPAADHQDTGSQSPDAPGSAHQDGDGNGECAFHCQFTFALPCGLSPYAGPVLAFSGTVQHDRKDPAPARRLVAIEHPPQLV